VIHGDPIGDEDVAFAETTVASNGAKTATRYIDANLVRVNRALTYVFVTQTQVDFDPSLERPIVASVPLSR
jgi:hypothetical protein